MERFSPGDMEWSNLHSDNVSSITPNTGRKSAGIR